MGEGCTGMGRLYLRWTWRSTRGGVLYQREGLQRGGGSSPRFWRLRYFRVLIGEIRRMVRGRAPGGGGHRCCYSSGSCCEKRGGVTGESEGVLLKSTKQVSPRESYLPSMSEMGSVNLTASGRHHQTLSEPNPANESAQRGHLQMKNVVSEIPVGEAEQNNPEW